MIRLRPSWRIPASRLVPRRYKSNLPLVSIKDATFYKRYPTEKDTEEINPSIFKGLDFTLPTNSPDSVSTQEHWAVLSPSSLARTSFLQVLAGSYISIPPKARTFPYISSVLSTYPSAAIHYIGFDADRTTPGASVRGAYLSARYEAHREKTDWTLQAFLTGDTELNPSGNREAVDQALLERCIKDLRLGKLLTMPVANLSNGQTRRARIAKALLAQPKVLLLDGPFMGLDPPSVSLLSEVLHDLAVRCKPRIVLSLRTGDAIPEWTSHLVALHDTKSVLACGPKSSVLPQLPSQPVEASEQTSLEGLPATHPPATSGEPIVEISGAKISYGDSQIIGHWPGGLHLTINRGSRLAVLGPNGSGKTTLLSLLTSDHPQTYAQPVKLFGRSRLPTRGQRGISLFELQRRIGHSSPEVHAFFPRELSLRRTLRSAWADAPLAPPELPPDAAETVDAALAHFAPELAAGPDTPFGELSFSAQRLALFVRALVAGQELVILDEAFSGMDRAAREKAFRFLADQMTDRRALVVVAHDRGDVPGVVREWLCLPEPAGEGQEQAAPRTGMLAGPLELRPEAWGEIWGTK